MALKLDKYINKLIDFAECLQSFCSYGDDMLNDVLIATFKSSKIELEHRLRLCVDKFYESYPPNSYDRTGALYEAIKVDIVNNGLGLSYDWGKQYLPNWHRADSSYIYDITFNKGYHGGATKGGGYMRESGIYSEPHPDNGTPYWKKPAKIWNQWWDFPAPKTTPIQHNLELAIKNFKAQNILQDYFDTHYPIIRREYLKKSGLYKYIK